MQAENQTQEFKQLWRDDCLKTICAFAKGEGDRLHAGVDDNGEVVGLENGLALLESLPNKIRNKLALLVDVTRHEQDGKGYLEISVKRTYAPVSYVSRITPSETSITPSANTDYGLIEFKGAPKTGGYCVTND